MKTSKLEVALTVVLVICSAIMVLTVGYNTFVLREPETERPRLLPGWPDALRFGYHLGGDPAAPVTLLVLSDLECPACRAFHYVVSDLLRERSDDLRVFFLGYPLDYHAHARPAALAAECAAEIDAAPQWIDAVFEQQDSLGIKSWGAYALSAGIADTAKIAACALNEHLPVRLKGSIGFGQEIELAGTPTVIVDGWQLPRPPSKQELNRMIDDLLVGNRLR